MTARERLARHLREEAKAHRDGIGVGNEHADFAVSMREYAALCETFADAVDLGSELFPAEATQCHS